MTEAKAVDSLLGQLAAAHKQLQAAKAERNRPKEQVARTLIDALLDRCLTIQTDKKAEVTDEPAARPGLDL